MKVQVEVGDRLARISNPGRVYFPARGETKLDLVRYYLSVGDGIVRALRERPCMMHRFPSGVAGREGAPEAGSARRAAVAGDGAGGLPALRPARRRTVRDRTGQRGVGGADVHRGVPPVELPPGRHRTARRVAHRPGSHAALRVRHRAPGRPHRARDTRRARDATGWPKTSGGNGLHIYVRIEPRWGFADVRRAAHAFAREVERRAPDQVTTTWWRKDRDPAMLFVDYNQNARDHTIASAYSVRGVPEATVSTPITWDEIDDVDPRQFTIATVPARFAKLGDLHQGIDDSAYSLDTLLEWWAQRDRLDEDSAPPRQRHWPHQRAGGPEADQHPRPDPDPNRTVGCAVDHCHMVTILTSRSESAGKPLAASFRLPSPTPRTRCCAGCAVHRTKYTLAIMAPSTTTAPPAMMIRSSGWSIDS